MCLLSWDVRTSKAHAFLPALLPPPPSPPTLSACLSHQQGLYYRDFKPDNVVYDMGSGLFRLIDFGLVVSDDLSDFFDAATIT